MDEMISLIVIGVVIFIVFFLLKILVKRTMQITFSIILMVFLAKYFEMSSCMIIILCFLIKYILNSLYIDLKKIIKCILSSSKKYKYNMLEKIVRLLFNINCLIFETAVYASNIIIIINEIDFVIAIKKIFMLLFIMIILKFVKRIIKSIFDKIK